MSEKVENQKNCPEILFCFVLFLSDSCQFQMQSVTVSEKCVGFKPLVNQ